jgi:hypothetical protein
MGFLNIVGFKYNVGIAYVNIFNDGRFNSSVWVLPKFVLVYGFIMQVLYVMYIGTICILYHHVGIVMGIPNQNVNLRELCKYANLSNFPSIMGRVPKSHSIHVQNPTKSNFSNKDLVWTFGIHHEGQNKVNIQFAYVPYAHISKFLEGEQGDKNTPWNGMFTNFL